MLRRPSILEHPFPALPALTLAAALAMVASGCGGSGELGAPPPGTGVDAGDGAGATPPADGGSDDGARPADGALPGRDSGPSGDAGTVTVDAAADAAAPDASGPGPDGPPADLTGTLPPDAGGGEPGAGGRARRLAKLFGYIFGDGNYFTDAAPPRNASFNTPRPEMANDFVHLACDSGLVPEIGGEDVDCQAFRDFVGSGGRGGIDRVNITLRDFAWPRGADLNAFGAEELKGFFSAILTVEGSATGQILDQFPGVPDGHYEAAGSIPHKLELILSALGRLGFTTARAVSAQRASCDGRPDSCRQVIIDRAEGCRFALVNGYDFVIARRVPGSTYDGSGDTEDPRNHLAPEACAP